MSGAPIHAEVLTAAGVAAARAHARASDELGFHLAGGTALALQLGHRKSVDFEWFRIGERFDPLLLAAGLEERGAHLEVRSMEPGTLHGLVLGVRVSWLAYPYALLAPTVRWEETGCSLAAPIDIAAMKLVAVSQRGVRKDFHDLVALSRSGIDLDSMLEAYRRRFRVGDVTHVLRALTWFDDAESEPPLEGTDATWDEVRREIGDAVRRLAR